MLFLLKMEIAKNEVFCCYFYYKCHRDDSVEEKTFFQQLQTSRNPFSFENEYFISIFQRKKTIVGKTGLFKFVANL